MHRQIIRIATGSLTHNITKVVCPISPTTQVKKRSLAEVKLIATENSRAWVHISVSLMPKSVFPTPKHCGFSLGPHRANLIHLPRN